MLIGGLILSSEPNRCLALPMRPHLFLYGLTEEENMIVENK